MNQNFVSEMTNRPNKTRLGNFQWQFFSIEIDLSRRTTEISKQLPKDHEKKGPV